MTATKNILKAGKAMLAGADSLREHEKITVWHTGEDACGVCVSLYGQAQGAAAKKAGT